MERSIADIFATTYEFKSYVNIGCEMHSPV